MWHSRLVRYAFLAASIFVVGWIVVRAVNPVWTNYCVLINGDGTHFGEVKLTFSSEDGTSEPDVHTIFVGPRLGAIAVLPMKYAFFRRTLSISDHSGLEIAKVDFNPPGRYHRTAVILLNHSQCKLEFEKVPTFTALQAGYYELDHPAESSVAEFPGKSKVSVWLSGHNGISLESASGEGWDNNLTLDQLKNRLEKTEDKTQAAIMLEKNFSGENKEDEAVSELLMQIGFETIVVQSCHSSATVIDKIIKSAK